MDYNMNYDTDYDYEAYKLLRQLKNECNGSSYCISNHIYIEIINDYHDAYLLLGLDKNTVSYEYKMNLYMQPTLKTYIEIYFSWGPICEDVWTIKMMRQIYREENVILLALSILLKNNVRIIIR